MPHRPPSVRPLAGIAAGLVLVALDFRTRALDLLPDPLGWALVAVGSAELSLVVPARAAVAAAVASVGDVVLPYRWVRVDPATGEVVDRPAAALLDYPEHLRWDAVSDGRALVLAASVLLGGVAVWTLLDGLAGRADRAGAAAASQRWRVLQVVVPAVWVLPHLAVVLVGVLGSTHYDPVWDGGLEPLALAGLAAVAWLVVTLVRERDASWALRPDTQRPSPWQRRRPGGAVSG
jgi:hypothetical protein